MNTKLQNNIMRRVYYTYALRLVTNPVLLYGVFMFVLLVALTQFVSISNVIQNMLNARVGDLDRFFYNAATNTEAWTLLILGVLIFSAFSLRVHLRGHTHIPRFAQ